MATGPEQAEGEGHSTVVHKERGHIVFGGHHPLYLGLGQFDLLVDTAILTCEEFVGDAEEGCVVAGHPLVVLIESDLHIHLVRGIEHIVCEVAHQF